MKRKIILFFVLISFASFFPDHKTLALQIFPGAYGWGTDTRAAYGGGVNPTVYRVTNLSKDDITGSLARCVNASGPRVCIFETSGTIRLTNDLVVINPYITIAGQTAPNPGIMIRGASFVIATHDVLVQHLRSRAGAESDGPSLENRDSIQVDNLYNQVYNVVIDHCSFSWAVDENASIYKAGIKNVSILNSIDSEGLYIAGHPSYPPGTPHSKGISVGPDISNITIYGNLFAHNHARNIKLAERSKAEEINNVIYNWGNYAVDVEGRLNLIGNHFISGNNTEGPPLLFRGTAAVIYTENNINGAAGNISTLATPLGVPRSAIKNASAVYDYVLNNAGARPANRDVVDTRIVKDVRNRTGVFKNTVTEAGGWPTLAANKRTLTLPTNAHADSDSDGYKNLEEWLHGYSCQVEGTSSPSCGGVPTDPPVNAPVVTMVTPVDAVDFDATPTFTFHSTSAGNISYSGACSSSTTTAIAGNNTITFNTLPLGIYSDCGLRVTNSAGIASALFNVNYFVITYRADLDRNRKVDIFDYSLFVKNFGLSGNITGDINRDNVVNIFDYSLFIADFGKSI